MQLAPSFKLLTSSEQLAEITAASHTRPQVVVKHSTRCGISAFALHRLNEGASKLSDADVHVLDLLRHRPLSNQIAEDWQVYHQSPQLLVLQKGEVTLELTHHEISADEVATFLLESAG